MDAAEQFELERKQKQMEERRKSLEDAQEKRFGKRYRGASLAQFKDHSPGITETILTFLKNPGRFLVFLGSPGVGKTYLCACLMGWRYWHEMEFFKRIRQGFDKYTNYDYLYEVELMTDDYAVILDDMGSSPPNDWRQECLFHFVNYRYNLQKPTIITSNLTRQQIKEKFDDRFYDRLFAKENIIIEEFSNHSFRQDGIDED